VVEAIGSRLKSRALVFKGGLSHVSRIGAAGVAVTILDDDLQVVKDGRCAIEPSILTCSMACRVRPSPEILGHNTAVAILDDDLQVVKDGRCVQGPAH